MAWTVKVPLLQGILGDHRCDLAGWEAGERPNTSLDKAFIHSLDNVKKFYVNFPIDYSQTAAPDLKI